MRKRGRGPERREDELAASARSGGVVGGGEFLQCSSYPLRSSFVGGVLLSTCEFCGWKVFLVLSDASREREERS
jgi:hypothetical protein